MSSSAPAYSIGGMTRPALDFDSSGNIILEGPAAEAAAAYGIKFLDAGLPAFPILPAVVAPLLATSGGVQASSPTAGETHLTQAELDSVVTAAIAEWAAAGASASQLAALHATTFTVADLAGTTIGEQSPGHITIDTDAAGHGWFVDPTPNDDFEFTHAAGADLFRSV